MHGEKIKIWNLAEEFSGDFSCMYKDFEKAVPAVPQTSSPWLGQARAGSGLEAIRQSGDLLLTSGSMHAPAPL